MSYTLVVVDMQFSFSASRNPKTIRNCEKQILQAMKNKCPIIFLEFKDYGPTLPELATLVESYNKAYFLTKSENDGSEEVLELLKKKRLPRRTFKVCGVNTDFCVLETVSGLLCRFKRSNIAVIKSACNTIYSNRDGFQSMKSFSKRVVCK